MTNEINTQLTLFDYQEMPLASLEFIIDRGLSTFIEVGMALMAIREGKKYKEVGYTDFNKYIEERWGMGFSYGNRLLNTSYVATELLPIGNSSPKHESQVRPLLRLGTHGNPKDGFPQPECWIDAWNSACDLAEGSVPTAKEVEFVVKELLFHESPPLPMDKYQVIYADPPWEYDNSGFDESAENQYPTMPIDAICDLSIKDMTNGASVLFLWATNPLLPEALKVIEAWGFKYKTNMAWIKDMGRGKGWYLKSKHELLLIATQQETLHPEYRPDSCFEADRGNVHSRKPEIAYEIIEKMYTGPKIELFARSKREGWESWGNEII